MKNKTKKILMVLLSSVIIMSNFVITPNNISFAATTYKIGKSHITQNSTTYNKYIAYSDSADAVVNYKKTVDYYNSQLKKSKNLKVSIIVDISQIAAYTLPILLDRTFITTVTYASPLAESAYGLYVDLKDYKMTGESERWRIQAMNANKKLSDMIRETERKRLDFLNYAKNDKTFVHPPGGN